jgi:hypothetical protein
MEKEEKQYRVGGIGNYYGGLYIMEGVDSFYWGIENWDGTSWEEIPQSLYNELFNLIK